MTLQIRHLVSLWVACASLIFIGKFATCQESTGAGEIEKSISLNIGDKAPKLAVDHWPSGTALESFSKDNIYVVEFWATWCGPCIKSMPHLSELADQYAKDGLVVVALTTTDEGNTREAIEQFINGPGKEFRFRYAICESDATYKAYMDAAQQKGIPCSFVIDREGKVAYIGHPHDLDYVIERLAAGKWRGKADADEIREMNESISKLGALAQSDPDKALQLVEHIRRVNPKRTASLDFSYAEVMILCKKKLFDRAKEVIELSMAPTKDAAAKEVAAKKIEWGAVAMLCGLLASKELNPEGQHRDYAMAKIKAAEEALHDDWQNLLQVGVSYQLSGDKDSYRKCFDRVIELCPDEQLKKSIRLALELQLSTSGK